jgi:hypothetical protein
MGSRSHHHAWGLDVARAMDRPGDGSDRRGLGLRRGLGGHHGTGNTATPAPASAGHHHLGPLTGHSDGRGRGPHGHHPRGYFIGGPTGSRVGWVTDGDTTMLASTFVGSTELTAVVPAALLRDPLTAHVFVLIGDPVEAGHTATTNALDFRIDPPGPPTRLRVVHADPHAGPMDVTIDETKLLSGLPYLTVSGYLELPSGAHDVAADISSGRMIDFKWSLAAGTDYTLLPCCALMGMGTLLRDDNSAPPEGKARIRFVDYASFADPVKIYVTAPGADLATVAPIALAGLGNSDYIELPAGDYQVRATVDGGVVIDRTLTLRSGDVRTVVAVDRAGGGPPYDLLVLEDRNPSAASDAGTLVLYGVSSSYLGRGLRGGSRQVALDGDPWRSLFAGQRLTYANVSAGNHQLRLSNPCTRDHEPAHQTVTIVAGDTVTVVVGIPLPCD